MHYSKARLGLSMPLIRGVFWAMALTPASLFVSKTCFLCLCATGKARRVSFLVSHPGKGGLFEGCQFPLPGNPNPSQGQHQSASSR